MEDNITRINREAAAMGLSYGKYKAMLYQKKLEKEEKARKEESIRKGALKPKKICIVCGKEIPEGSRRIKYCSQSCARTAARRRYL